MEQYWAPTIMENGQLKLINRQDDEFKLTLFLVVKLTPGFNPNNLECYFDCVKYATKA